MKKWIVSIIAVVLIATAVAGFAACTTFDGDYVVGIVQIIEHTALDQSYEGFKDGLSEMMAEYDLTVSFDYQNAQGDSTYITNIVDRFVSNKVYDMILAIGTGAAQVAAAKTKENKKPTLFTAVTNPVETNIVADFNEPGANVTGTSDLADLDQQAQLMIDLFDGVKTADQIKVGMLYTTKEKNSEWQIGEMKRILKSKGMPEPLVKGISELSDINATYRTLKDCDVVFIPTDNMIASGIETVNSVNTDPTNGLNLPIVCGDIGMTEKCGVATVGVDFYKLGRQTARMAFEILKNGKDPATYPVEFMEDCQLQVFEAKAREIGFTLPQKIKNQLAAA